MQPNPSAADVKRHSAIIFRLTAEVIKINNAALFCVKMSIHYGDFGYFEWQEGGFCPLN